MCPICSTRIRTGVTRFRVWGANHYTIPQQIATCLGRLAKVVFYSVIPDQKGIVLWQFESFILYLAVWGVEPVVTHQTSWLESTGVKLEKLLR